MVAGASRIVEICVFLRDGPSDPSNIRIFQYLPPYVSDQKPLSSGISQTEPLSLRIAVGTWRDYVHERN
jgi:hypothetical protein